MSVPTLRPYQEAASADVWKAIEAGQRRLLVKKPTGVGKTVWFASLLQYPPLKAWLEQFPANERKMLVIAHREELLDQSVEKIRAQNPGLMVSVEQGDRVANRYSDVVVASIQTLSARKFTRMKRLLESHVFRLVIVDEAHHAAAASYRTALVHLGFLPPADASESGEIEAATHDDVKAMTTALEGWDLVAPKDRILIGVTATPNRTDAIGLGCVMQTIAYSYGLKQAIDDHWLVPLKPWVIETTENLDQVRITAGEFNQKDLAETVNTARRNRLAVDAWKQYASDRSTLAFTVDVAHAHDLAAVFQADGIRAKALSGETPKDERREMLAAYLRGDVQVLTNCMVLTEGTDLPRTGCILHAKPTKSATLYEQMTGRGLRLFPGKENCLVLDLVDVARRHSLQAAPVLYGLPPGIKTKGEDLAKLENDLEELREKYPNADLEKMLTEGRFSMKELFDRASTFDIWTVPSLGDFATGLTCDWIRVSEDRYRLQYPWADGTEIIQVSKDMLGHWEVSLTLRPNPEKVTPPGQNSRYYPRQHTVYPPSRQRTIAAQIETAHAAALLAEAFMDQERRSATKLTNRDAEWKKRPASDKQLAFLRRLGVPLDPKKRLTMGEASRQINWMKARGR
jgi:ATP-dependent helicase IRC3